MDNDIYQKVKNFQIEAEKELQEILKKEGLPELKIKTSIHILNIPINRMPENCKPLTVSGIHWLSYAPFNEGICLSSVNI